MKKLLLLPVLFITLFSCSTEDVDVAMAQEEATTNFSDAKPIPNCVSNFWAYTIINVEAGFGNPVVEFWTAPVANISKKQYTIQLEVQQISDCEDINSNMGAPITFDPLVVYLSNDQRVMSLLPSQLPASCYKWRFVVTPGPGATGFCTTASPWYEAPLF